MEQDGYAECMETLKHFEDGTLHQRPGCTPEQTLEAEMNGRLSKIREDAGDVCKRELHYLNAPLTMATCGSKGSFINISQVPANRLWAPTYHALLLAPSQPPYRTH